MFDRKQAAKRLTYRERIPELIIPHALRVRIRIDLLDKLLSQPESLSCFLNNRSLPEQLGTLCAAAFIENLCGLAAVSSQMFFNSVSAPSNLEDVKNVIANAAEQFRRIIKNIYLEGHTDKVNSIAVLANGVGVSASDDGTLRVWDLRSGDRLQTLRGHNSPVISVTVTENGACVSGSKDGTLRVWDIHTGKCLHTLKEHSGWVTCHAIIADDLCISGSMDKSLCIWNIRSGKRLHILKGHRAVITCVSVTASGLCISGSWDNTLRVWDIPSGKRIHIFKGHTSWITCTSVTKDNLCISGSDDEFY